MVVKYANKQRLLLVASRGISARQRHLLEDLGRLLPHHKKEAKLDAKGQPRVLAEIAELKSCNGCLYLEARKRGLDLYMWLARFPRGPTLKFHVLNVHTMDELRLTGNCSMGSRPLLCFDRAFDRSPAWGLCKRALSLTFGTPRGHPKSKPFFDHAISFAILDDKIWIRHYQIDKENLVEIGPRFVLALIRVFAGPFAGPTLYHSPEPLASGSDGAPRKKKATYQERKLAQTLRGEHKLANTLPPDELASLFKQPTDDHLGL